MVYLYDLRLDNNQLTGEIPAEIRFLTNLRYLRLNDNELSGPIPEGLVNLTNLDYLSLDIEEFDYHAVSAELYEFMRSKHVVFPSDYVVPISPPAGMEAIRMLLLE
jgi:hypothetical protein